MSPGLGGSSGFSRSGAARSGAVYSGAVKSMPKLTAAIRAVLAGTGYCTILGEGDSTMMGVAYGSPDLNPTDPYTIAARHYTFIARMADRLRAKGIPVSTDNFMGTQVRSSELMSAYAAYNPQMVAGTDWTVSTVQSLGGYLFRKASVNAGPMLFTTNDPCTHFDIFLTNNSGAYTIKIDGVEVMTYTATGATAPVKITTPAVAEGVHELSIDTTSAATANIIGAIARNSITRRVDIINAGQRAVTAVTVADNTTNYGARKTLPLVAADMTILCLGINDVRTGGNNTSVPALTTSMTALADVALLTGDLLLLSPHNISPAADAGSGAHMSDLYALYRTLAVSKAANLIETPRLIGPYNLINQKGGIQVDGLHLQDRSLATVIGNALGDVAFNAAVAGGLVTQAA